VTVDRARKLALDTLSRIERSDAYANLQLPATLGRSGLDQRDRGFVTELVYGTIRMRRACDWLVDRFVQRELDVQTRDLLRMGAYQLHFMGTPAYAVVSTSVELAGRASRLVEAVLRRVAESTPLSEGKVSLTSREMQVLRGVAKGYTTKHLAKDLGLAAPSVETHLRNIFKKLGSGNRGEAVSSALKLGLITLADL